jgi:exonuclease III
MFDLNDIDWFSPETRDLYERINRVFSKNSKKKFKSILDIKIDPIEFNDAIRQIYNRNPRYQWSYRVKVWICVDYNLWHKETVDIVDGTQDILETVTTMMGSDLFIGNKLLQSYEVNDKLFCKGKLS